MGDVEKEEKPNVNASEKEPKNLEKVQNQKHTEARILKLEKPVRIIVVNGGSVLLDDAPEELHYFLLCNIFFMFFEKKYKKYMDNKVVIDRKN